MLDKFPMDKIGANTIMWLVKSHISSSIPVTLDPLQFAYRSNRSTDDAISHILHSSLTHIDSSNGNYARLLFIDYSSAFNTIVPIKLTNKLTGLGLNTSLCDWIQDFLTGRPQVVKVGQYTSNSITLNVGAPQGCVLSPLLYSLYTHDCVSSHRSTSIIKFADDTVVLGLISNNDETAYLDEVERLTSWCQDNCLSLNVSKTKELIVDFRKRHLLPYTPLVISGTPVERVSSFKYLGVNISEDLTWTTHIQTQVKKARQRLYHLRQLRKFRVSPTILKTFYAGTIESVLTQCISVWYGNNSSQDCKALQRVVRLAERISGSALPSLQDIYLKRCRSRAVKIIKDSNHPGNCLFTLLPSGKRFRSLMAKTERLRRSFFPQAIRLLNSNSASKHHLTYFIITKTHTHYSLPHTDSVIAHLHTTLSVSWYHILSYFLYLFYFIFLWLAASCQPCSTCLHIPLCTVMLILIFNSTAYCHAHSFIFIFYSLYLIFYSFYFMYTSLVLYFSIFALSMERTRLTFHCWLYNLCIVVYVTNKTWNLKLE